MPVVTIILSILYALIFNKDKGMAQIVLSFAMRFGRQAC